jgi:hypothetical protein
VVTNLKKEVAKEKQLRREKEEEMEDLSVAYMRASDIEAAAAAMKLDLERKVEASAVELAAAKVRCVSCDVTPARNADD